MNNWESTLVRSGSSLRQALAIIDATGTQIALIVDEKRRLLGTLSDGDVRRAILSGLGLEEQIDNVMHSGATVINSLATPNEIQTMMHRTGCHQLPIVDEEGIVVGLAIVNDYLHFSQRENWVVIMAGGLGSRLRELTLNTPKPMLKVGSRPLLETIVRGYANQGFRNFYMAVNYKAEQIVDYFGDGTAFGVDIRYLHEKKRMGTAGALSMLPKRPTSPFIVTNADLLTKVNFGQLVDQHAALGVQATMAVRHYEMQVPYGVVNVCNRHIYSIEEKPVQRFLVSAGINVLSPDVLDLVPTNQFFDMPSLFDVMLENGMKAHAYQIDDYWLDIGQPPDYEKANFEYEKIFND